MDGWINLLKPKGISSSFALQPLRYYFKNKKRVGHIGTLDPFASGVLPVAIGEATKTIEYLSDFTKTYVADVAWGYVTDTLDETGLVTERTKFCPSYDQILETLPQFVGVKEQLPPKFSANKINGIRAYKLARKDAEFETKPKTVECLSIEILAHDPILHTTKFKISCGRGFYIRALVADIANHLGSLATTLDLARVRDGIFFEKDGIKLDLLKKILHNDAKLLQHHMVPAANVLDDILVFAVSLEDATRLKNGLMANLPVSHQAIDGQIVQVRHNDELVAMCKVLQHKLKPIKVFNLIDYN